MNDTIRTLLDASGRKRYRTRPHSPPTATEAAELVAGTLTGAAVDDAVRFSGVATLPEAGHEDISFLASAKKSADAERSRAGLLIVPRGVTFDGRATLEVDSVWGAVATLLTHMYAGAEHEGRVHPSAVLGERVVLGDWVTVGANAVIGHDVQIGEGSSIGPGCVIDAGCVIGAKADLRANVTIQGPAVIGARVLLHPGVVLGADGFRFEPVGGRLTKIPQIGVIVIEDDVEIGANSAVDRPFLHETRIGAGTKIDNLVQIGHNCNIGRSCVIAGSVGMAGSVTLGDGCFVGGGSMFKDNITIGAGTMIGGFTGVRSDLPPGSKVSGVLMLPIREDLKVISLQRRLPELVRRLAAAERKIEDSAT